MLDLKILEGTLDIAENPGMDTLDPRFQDLAAVVESEDFAKVGTQCEALLGEKIYDIRVLCYYLAAVVVEQGIPCFASLLRCLAGLFGENWNAVGPVPKKEKHTQRSLNWFLGKLLDQLKYHQEKADGEWQKWLAQTRAEDIQPILDANQGCRDALAQILPDDQTSQEQLGKIGEWFLEFHKIIYVAPEPEPQADTETPAEAQPAAQGTTLPGTTVEVSYPFLMLIKKLEAFEKLVQAGDFTKAAVVADDINTIISSFDPRIYFPKTFAKYYQLLSTSINDIVVNWDNKESVQWQAIAQFYHVDLDGFVNG